MFRVQYKLVRLESEQKNMNYIKRKHSIKKILELAEDFKITIMSILRNLQNNIDIMEKYKSYYRITIQQFL